MPFPPTFPTLLCYDTTLYALALSGRVIMTAMEGDSG